MIDKAKSFLLARGYQIVRESSNIVMARETEDVVYLVLVTEYNNKIPISFYLQAASGIRISYAQAVGKRIEFLNICYTPDGMFDEEMTLAKQLDGIWFVAEDTGIVYVFENQPVDFDHIYQDFETESRRVENRIRFIPYANWMFVAINIGFYILVYHVLNVSQAQRALSDFGLEWSRVLQNGEWYRLLTCMFLHADAAHIYGNMLLLFFVGGYMEEAVGHLQYTLLYISTGIAASIGSMLYHYMIMESVVCIGASGAIMGVLGAMTGMLLIYRGRSKRITLRRLLIFLGLTLAQGAMAPQVDNAAHLCGFLAGFLFAVLSYYRYKKSDKKIG